MFYLNESYKVLRSIFQKHHIRFTTPVIVNVTTVNSHMFIDKIKKGYCSFIEERFVDLDFDEIPAADNRYPKIMIIQV